MPTKEEVTQYAKEKSISFKEANKRIYGHIAKIRFEKGEASAERVAKGMSKSMKKRYDI